MQKADVYHDAFPHIILCVSFTLFAVFDVSSSAAATHLDTSKKHRPPTNILDTQK